MKRVLCVILICLLPGLASADELLRRLVLFDGTEFEGIVVERGDGFLVLELHSGQLREFDSASIERIEVLDEHRPGGYEAPAMSLRELRERRARIKEGQVLAGAPSFPLLGAGVGMMFGFPHFAGEVRALRPVLALPGLAALAGSIATSFEGARLARAHALDPLDEAPLIAGFSLAVAGSVMTVVSIGGAHDLDAQLQILRSSPTPADANARAVASQQQATLSQQAIAARPLSAAGIGAMVVGELILIIDTKRHRNQLERELRRRKKRHGGVERRLRPRIAGGFVAPGTQGLSLGLSGSW